MHVLQEMLEDAGYDVRAYSGRTMGGRKCLAVSLDSNALGELFAAVLGEAGATLEDADISSICKAFRGMATDTFGSGIIVYWPGVAYEGEQD